MSEEEVVLELPPNSEFYISTPLYKTVNLEGLDAESKKGYINSIRIPENTIDAYCIECHKTSTFDGYFVLTRARVVDRNTASKKEESIHNFIVVVELRCTRDISRRMYVFFRMGDESITKIGQYPSIADLSTQKISPYRKVLSPEKYKELSRAIGLVSHGVGIGAFVYLRRIFESLIEKAYAAEKATDQEEKKIAKEEASSSSDDVAFKAARMEEKIMMVKDFLPVFLVENRKLYSILSKGIHELGEEECLKYFPVVMIGIELILDEELERQKQQEKMKQSQELITDIQQELEDR